MGYAEPVARLSHEDFLAWEARQPSKHEFVNGNVFARAAARRTHVTVTGNVLALLKAHLRGGPCRAFASDMMVRVADANADFYPDVVVTCDENDKRAERMLTAPTLIVEVLSESTEGHDRGLKFELYRKLRSLREYVLVDPDRPKVDVYRPNASGKWELHEYSAPAEVVFESLDFTMPWSEVFAEL